MGLRLFMSWRYVYTYSMVYELSYRRDNQDYRVIVTIKAIKNVIFRFRDHAFYVSAPRRTKDATIIAYLDKFYERLLAKNAQSTTPFVGNQVYLLGELFDLYEGEAVKNTFFYGNGLYFKDQNDFDKKLRKFAKEYYTLRVRHHEQIMKIKKPYDIKVRDMKTRFGTNSRKTHALSFQLRLIHFHPSIIDAIIIHELAHDRNFDHGVSFYQELYKYCPDYKILVKRLKKGLFA
jgi:predicted metal-dependent hydrolase